MEKIDFGYNPKFQINKKRKFYLFPFNFLIKLCKEADNYLPLILLFDQYFDIDIIKGIKENIFINFESIYDILKYYLKYLLILERYDFFKKSRYYCNCLLKIGEYNKYINFLFIIKLYTYYLKLEIKNIILREYIFQYSEKYSVEDFKLEIRTTNIENLLENENNNANLEHYLYELILKSYAEKKDINLEEESDLFFEIHLNALNDFIENYNIEWIKKYWKYVKKTDIYNNIITEKMTKEEEAKEYYLPETIIKLANSKTNRKFLKVYLKNKDEIDFILCQGYFVEDISEDKDFIFNKMKNVKHVNNYKFGYTKEILSEIDFILNHINNNDTILKKYNINKLYNIYYYKTILNIDYYTINLFKPIFKDKFENDILFAKEDKPNSIRCPYRKKSKYYNSVKYEVPFTRVNSLYKQDSDNYIKKYFKSILEYLDKLCKELDNFFELKNKNSINDYILQSKIIYLIKKKNMEAFKEHLKSNKDDNYIYYEIFIRDDFFKFFILKILLFFYSPRINKILSLYEYNNERITFNIDGNIKSKKINFFYREKRDLENNLKIIVLFSFNMQKKNNLEELKFFLNDLKEIIIKINKKFSFSGFFNILNNFNDSKCISKILFIDNKNAYKLYSDIYNLCYTLNISSKEINENAYNASKISSKEIFSYKLNRFYFDYFVLKELFHSIRNSRSISIKSKKINKDLIYHLFKNNINLFFSYIYNKLDKLFYNDYIYIKNIYINKINEDTKINFEFFKVRYYFAVSDNENTRMINPFKNNKKKYNYIIKSYFNIKDLTNAYNQIILNNNIIKYDTFFKNLSIVLYKNRKLHTKIYKDKYNDIDYDLNHEILSWNIIKEHKYYKDAEYDGKSFYIVNLIYDSERSTPILLSESDNSSYNESNISDSSDSSNSSNNRTLTIEKNSLYKQNFDILEDQFRTRKILYCVYKKFKTFNIRYKKSNYKKFEINDFNIIYNEYYKKLRSYYAYDFILDILKFTLCYEDNIYKFKINLKNHSEYNIIPNLLVDYEYSNEYIRFLESIIEFYDAGLNYKYNGLIINNFSTNEDDENSESEDSDNEEERNKINNLNDLYHNFYNIKLTNNELYEIVNENKNFFALTMGIYLLNSNYSSNYIYNTLNNINYCHYNEMVFKSGIISKWLKWINNYLFTNETNNFYDNPNKEEQTILYSIKDFFKFDDYTTINRIALPSFLYYLNYNNIYNTYNLKLG
ncbi:hypothetical protein U3516DRAFT_827070 [Neocallimastix sp. 'constans']